MKEVFIKLKRLNGIIKNQYLVSAGIQMEVFVLVLGLWKSGICLSHHDCVFLSKEAE